MCAKGRNDLQKEKTERVTDTSANGRYGIVVSSGMSFIRGGGKVYD